jgi:serine/threonine protein phosphatase PrpC
MIIKTVLKKGSDHLVNCEDDLHICENTTIDGEEYQIGGIFDGCSTGYKSHFASTLFGKILKEVLKTTTFDLFDKDYNLDEIAKATFVKLFFKLKEISDSLSLQDLELLSTFIIVFIKDNKSYFIVSGDGCIMVDDQEIKIVKIRIVKTRRICYIAFISKKL